MSETCTKTSSNSNQTNLDRVVRLINERTVTAKDFDVFLESLPRSTDERSIHRRVRPPQTSPRIPTPSRRADKNLAHDGDTSPLRTARGRRAVEKRGKENKKNRNRFTEAAEIISKWQGKPISEVVLPEDVNFVALETLATRLLRESKIDRDWMYSFLSHVRKLYASK